MAAGAVSSKRGGWTRASLTVALCLAVWTGGSFGETEGPLHTTGLWLVDGAGRVVVLHGLNIVPLDESTPAPLPIGDEDVHLLASHGFNTVRLGVLYSLVKPQPDRFDDAYIERIADLQRRFAEAGLQVLIDFHQDAFDRGMPEWTTDTDGLPFTPIHPLFDPARNRAWDNFWANAPAPDGMPMWDHYAGALARVAARFRDAPGVLGYDLMNEPWPGSRWPTCANPTGFVGRRIGEDAYPLFTGCPPGGFDQTDLTEFMRRMAGAVRAADPGHALFVEPNLLFDFGPQTGLGTIEDANVVFSYHAYCFANVASFSFGFTPPDDPEELCREQEGLVLNNAASYSSRSGTALMLTEFGSTGDPAAVRRTVELADERGQSWQYWAYFDTTYRSSPGNILRDPEEPRAGDNINWGVLDMLIRPYPQVVAGTPLTYGFDADTGVFTLRYSTERVDGAGVFPPDAITEIFVPARRYPDGYRVTVEGAEVIPSADPQRLHLGNTTGTEVSLRIEPATD